MIDEKSLLVWLESIRRGDPQIGLLEKFLLINGHKEMVETIWSKWRVPSLNYEILRRELVTVAYEALQEDQVV